MSADTGAPRATVFDVQRFSLHDGPGIRTVVFFKGCSLRCPWCHNPEGLARTPEVTWLRGRCEECFECERTCPRGAVLCEAGRRIDWAACDHCGACVEACPSGALRRRGEELSVDDLYRRCMEDREFYAATGGGVTLSGGEPVLQAAVAGSLLERLRACGVHTLVETAGSYPFELLEPLLDRLDALYFDWKLPSPTDYAVVTGGGGLRVADNLRRLLARRVPVTVRVPQVPGLNDRPEQVRAMAATLRALGVREVVVLRYNDLWEAKLPTLSRPPPALGCKPGTAAEDMVAGLCAQGIEARASWSAGHAGGCR